MTRAPLAPGDDPDGMHAGEYAGRVTRVQALLAADGFGGLLVTTPEEFTYFTGFLTRFWQSPSRPWFLLIPVEGAPVAVIPSIGAHLMARTGLRDIRTWPAPDDADEGLSLLLATLRECLPPRAPLAVPDGREAVLRLSLGALERLRAGLGGRSLTGDGGMVRGLRAIKSEAEIAAIRESCASAGRAFDRLPEIAGPGVPLETVFRRFQALLLEEGADWVGYLAGGAGPGGYGDVISPAGAHPLAPGDVLMLDTGAVRQGYFCDFDRNFAIGHADARSVDAHARLLDAARAAQAVARPGATAADLFHAMSPALGGAAVAGRRGHGLGLQLTEGLSLLARDRTELRPGMVLTLEPAIETAPGRLMVHEENIVITQAGAEMLSPPAPETLPVLEALP